jgi:bacterioferritin (cytochrome b1)
MNKILIHKGDSTIFANVNKFLTFNLETELDLTGWTAKFILGWVEKTIDDISTKSFEIVLCAEDTKQLRLGKQYGTIILTDVDGNTKTVTNTIPFEVTNKVVENEYQEIDLTVPESSGVDIKLKVGSMSASAVTSVNGQVGDVVLNIPDVSGLVTEEQLNNALATKQAVGDYVTREEFNSSLVDIETLLAEV